MVRDGESARVWQIGIVGTFDVQNYGDLLFPLIAEAELTARLGPVELHRFSYHARSAPLWPYDVTSLADLPSMIGRLDAMLIGGGFLIRFDKFVAEDYVPPSPRIHHPTGYWLTPALMSLSAGVPVAWNAPGMHCNDIPAWAGPLLRLALAGSASIAVRDELSKVALSPFVDADRIAVVPDTGFGLARLLPQRESDAMRELRAQAGLEKPYLIVQPVRWRDAEFPAFLARNSERLADYRLLALPVGPVLGESEAMLGAEASRFVRLPFWPEPVLMAELVRGASAVIAHSYHLMITALVCGVPVFTSADLDSGKFAALRAFESVQRLDSIDDPEAFFSRLGRTEPEASVLATLPRLATHWDGIAQTVRDGRVNGQAELGRFWQHLPSLLEPPEVQVPPRRPAYRLLSRVRTALRRNRKL